MKRISVIFLIGLCLSCYAKVLIAQNLVFNGSFEIRDSVYDQFVVAGYYSCPFSDDDIDLPMLVLAKGWVNIQGKYLNQWYSSFDYYHSCNNFVDSFPNVVLPGYVGVPSNRLFTKYQYPRTGHGYTAGLFYNNSPYYSINPGELIQSKLLFGLQKDSLYILRFFVNLANSSQISINSQGALLTNNAIQISNLYAGLLDFTITPQLLNQNGYIEDTLNWTEIKGVVKAIGIEQYITLGNFNILKGFEKLFNPNAQYASAHYAVDDISLFPMSAPVDSARCGNDTVICLGNSIKLGKSNVKPEYKQEYSFEWTVSGRENSVFSYDEHPVVTPDSTTTYIVKVIDFKFDKTTDSITVKVVDCTEPTSLVVYPNPSFGEFVFSFNAPIPEGISIEIYDITGRLLKIEPLEQNYESKEVQIDIKTYPAGLYLYSVVLNGQRKFNGKLILIK